MYESIGMVVVVDIVVDGDDDDDDLFEIVWHQVFPVLSLVF
jgi:hypothetical protein